MNTGMRCQYPSWYHRYLHSHDGVKHVPDLQAGCQTVGWRVPAVQRERWRTRENPQSINQSINELMSLNTHYTYKSTQIHCSRSQRHIVHSKQGGTDTTLMIEPNPMLDTVIGTVVLANIFCGMGTDSGIGIATSITLT